jgi:hypothetical protein
MGRHQVTHPSKSKTRSVAAIGNGCVIPAKAGIQVCVKSQWIPAFAGMTAEVTAVAHPSKSKTRSVRRDWQPMTAQA